MAHGPTDEHPGHPKCPGAPAAYLPRSLDRRIVSRIEEH